MEIKHTKTALKTLRGYDRITREFIREKIKGLAKTPPAGDIAQMSGSADKFRLRVGKYRVIYEYIIQNNVKILMVNKIDSRGGIYKE
ncbi:MAG: type II toxin-antitoxin system RelE/ParE family toxin [Oscillospiraceae bacterium]|nr:type II toxin-antitoxin system RelE/ParE family toxin [Oscillospiraceae bacterium]